MRRVRSTKQKIRDANNSLLGFTNPDEFFDFIDRYYQANLAKLTAGMSPAAFGTAYYSWLSQLLISPGRLLELAFYPLIYSGECKNKIYCEERGGKGTDVRFKTEDWQYFPWRLWAENFLMCEDWWSRATTRLPGLPKPVGRIVSFLTRQMLDALSPSNFVLTNPDLFHETIRDNGLNLVHGTKLAVSDMLEKLIGIPPAGVENFIPGEHVAITPGKVVYSNHLIELIQYEPQTKTVVKEPLLLLPAWIMKYYILDLSPENSMVKWLVQHGHTVFIVSWRNPGAEDRNLGMDDYYRLGAMAAIDAVSAIFPRRKINLMGYCLGGTLAMLTAAAMARNGDKRLNSISLIAAQADFTDAGELMVFATQSEIAFLKSMMWEQGYLDTKQMAGSFQMLRSYDLIWSKMIHDYMNGTQRGMIDLLAWNADSTRMPYKMHSEYLERLFLNDDFAEGRYKVEGKPVAPKNIRIPVFVVSADNDHVAPWQSVYKIHLMIDSERMTFVLANGGHNAGIISQPGKKGRFYRIYERRKEDPYLDAEDWLGIAEVKKGSWWDAWNKWLIQQSSEKRLAARALKRNLAAAPGTYVLQK
ncbi:Poly-beta-hydroxybutyrate polymerase [Legionella massiliensis]|uniref:Poly-beta-hydroxybutyrate polymerase n=1 Tax=Legionella massiliensis TaxID=1034943 RepID=A0A078KTP7_9GAMM|nr:alpha/beta fold hydrolase [Legionella massiliensis]CDZ77835.1 Poly-beta-hydroxybutyrate polymerase [Legionella massiliensis]CEE13573.1 Poly-beta-hydroxybutyrate polymerase [Legionella massiliensis]